MENLNAEDAQKQRKDEPNYNPTKNNHLLELSS